MKGLLIKLGIALFGAIVTLIAGSMKTYTESAKMAALLVFVLATFLAILDEKLMREEHQRHKKQQ